MRDRCDQKVPAGSLWNTSAYEAELSVPFNPVPPLAPTVVHDTFEVGMPRPLGGVNAAPSACTLTRSAFPGLRCALEKPTVIGLGPPLVLWVTSVTEKLTADGTTMLTVSWAAAEAAVATHAMVPDTAIRVARHRADQMRLIEVAHA